MREIPRTKDGGIELKYVRDLFHGFHRLYDFVLTLMTLGQDVVWKSVLKSFINTSNTRMLDVGTGTGMLSLSLSKDNEVIGIDLTLSMLRLANRKRRKNKHRLDLIVAIAESLPFRQDTFNYIFSCYVMKYCNRSKFIEELWRVSKDGARVSIYDFLEPKGKRSLIHRFYIFKVMPSLAKVLRRASKGLAKVFTELPIIISNVDWYTHLPRLLAVKGIKDIRCIELTGGVVKIIFATVNKVRG